MSTYEYVKLHSYVPVTKMPMATYSPHKSFVIIFPLVSLYNSAKWSTNICHPIELCFSTWYNWHLYIWCIIAIDIIDFLLAFQNERLDSHSFVFILFIDHFEYDYRTYQIAVHSWKYTLQVLNQICLAIKLMLREMCDWCYI